jgi:hypothetical protein
MAMWASSWLGQETIAGKDGDGSGEGAGAARVCGVAAAGDTGVDGSGHGGKEQADGEADAAFDEEVLVGAIGKEQDCQQGEARGGTRAGANSRGWTPRRRGPGWRG